MIFFKKKSGFLVYRSGYQMLYRDGFTKIMWDYFATKHLAGWAAVPFLWSFILTSPEVTREETFTSTPLFEH